MINAGDIVRSINPNGSVKEVGQVVAIYEPQYFMENLCAQDSDPSKAWAERFPDWDEKPIILVSFPSKHKIATITEWIRDGMKKGLTQEQCVAEYQFCPTLSRMAFPYDDLEIVEPRY